MSKLIRPVDYKPLLNVRQTEQGIKMIKDFFQQNLSTELRLRRVTAPLFVLKGLGINDDLNGTERPVTFPIKDLGDAQAEVVHSLAKWKRLTLAEYAVEPGYGIYTDMNAIRADEELLPIKLWIATLFPLLTFFLLYRLMKRRLQGYTGDCCGATFLLCELSFYLGSLILIIN